MNRSELIRRLAVSLLAVSGAASLASAGGSLQTAAITYQGVLRSSGALVNGSVDLECRLFDAAVAGAPVGGVIALNNVSVIEGVFTSSLDFGVAAYNGEERWLEIAVRAPAGSANPFVTLAPRQKIESAPYAAYALNAALSGTYASAVNFNNAANAFTGNGAGLTALNASNLASGTVAAARLSGTYNIGISGNAATATTATSATTAGNVTGIVGIANGGTAASNAASARANLGAAAITHTHSAADLTSGNLTVARMPTGGAWSLTSNLNVDAGTLVVDQANSRVGIGNAAPQSALHVGGAYAATIPTSIARVNGSMSVNGTVLSEEGNILSRSAAGLNAAGLVLDAEADAGGTSWFITSHANASPFGSPGGSLTFTNSEDRLAITGAGNVGIGTTAPTAKFSVRQDNAAPIFLAQDGATTVMAINDGGNVGVGTAAPTARFTVRQDTAAPIFTALDGATTVMTIADGGNVGIGTASPTGKLHVTGSGDSSVVLPSASISSTETSNEPGVANIHIFHDGFVLPFDANGPFVVTSRSINCPASGHVLAIGTLQIHGHPQPTSDSFAHVGVSDTTSFPASQTCITSVLSGKDVIVTVQGLFAVSAGSQAISLLVEVDSGAAPLLASAAHLTLLYLPTTYGSVLPD